MLVLSRFRDERVVITGSNGERTTLTVVDIRGDKVRLGFDAPAAVAVHREEIQDRVDRGERPR